MTDTPTPRTGPLIAAGLLLLTASLSLFARCHLQTDPTEPQQWQQAAETAVELAEPTDGIRIHPPWSETPLPHLTEVGNLLHPHHQPLLEDLVGIQRLLVLTESHRHQEALARLPFDADTDDIHDFGSVRLLEVSVPEPLRIESGLNAALSEARVTLVGTDGDEHRCHHRPTPDAWSCSAGDTSAEVRSELLEVEDEPRRCIRSDPPEGNYHLAVETTIDPRDVLRIRAGLDQRAARLERGGDVNYRIYIGDVRLTEQRVDAHTSQWVSHDVPNTDGDGDTVDLRIEVESVAPTPHHRRFCFNAWGLTQQQAK